MPRWSCWRRSWPGSRSSSCRRSLRRRAPGRTAPRARGPGSAFDSYLLLVGGCLTDDPSAPRGTGATDARPRGLHPRTAQRAAILHGRDKSQRPGRSRSFTEALQDRSTLGLMRLRLLVAPLVIAALAAASAGCGGTTAEPAASAGTETRPATTTTGTTTVAPTTVADPLAGAGTDPVEAAPVGSETALLERVAVGRHEGYDRVVFQF